MTSQEDADDMLREDQDRRRGEAMMRYAQDNREQDGRFATMVCLSVIILVFVGVIASMISQ